MQAGSRLAASWIERNFAEKGIGAMMGNNLNAINRSAVWTCTDEGQLHPQLGYWECA